jgi:hypothetical protein
LPGSLADCLCTMLSTSVFVLCGVAYCEPWRTLAMVRRVWDPGAGFHEGACGSCYEVRCLSGPIIRDYQQTLVRYNAPGLYEVDAEVRASPPGGGAWERTRHNAGRFGFAFEFEIYGIRSRPSAYSYSVQGIKYRGVSTLCPGLSCGLNQRGTVR